ncbi:MAG: hypothetical protein IIX10_04720 [Clostridia bacterium]|nr:hypothetical protein [Clostridia bacterium]MBR6526088.1 hypothetical protein [Clostridia bacterium]
MRVKKNEKHLSLRIDEGLLRKFEQVAKYDDRSMNWLLLALIRKCVENFEAEHGPLETEQRVD